MNLSAAALGWSGTWALALGAVCAAERPTDGDGTPEIVAACAFSDELGIVSLR